MKKHTTYTRKTLALLLALFMLAGLLAGCTDTEETPSTEPTPSTASTEPLTTPETPNEGDEVVETELPLVDDTYTFEYWLPQSDSFEDFASYDDNTFYQWMEEITNVHLQFIHPTGGSSRESFQTMVLSGDYPDFVQGTFNYYDGGVDKAISDNFIIALNDYVDKLPNYVKVVYEDNETFVQAVSDEGNLWGIHRIDNVAQGAYMGLGLRSDWLEKAGKTVADVETIDGLEEILEIFKGYTYENSGPLHLSSGGFQWSQALNGSWNASALSAEPFMNINGTAAYSPMQTGFRDYVAKMADWNAKGLINRNWIADASWGVPDDRWANSEVGVGEFAYTYAAAVTVAAQNSEIMPSPDFHLVAVPTPKLSEDHSWDDIHLRNASSRVRVENSLGFTTQCSNIDLACAYWNYVWSEEGIIASNWGQIEGEYGDTNAHYYIDETDANGDGHTYCYQPWMMEKWNNANHIQTKFSINNGPSYSYWSREWCVLTKEEIEYCTIWDTVDADYVWPSGVSLTADEGATASSIVTACNTAVNTWIAEVIIGEKSVDTWETELLPQLESHGIETAVNCYQAALTRYTQRIEFIAE